MPGWDRNSPNAVSAIAAAALGAGEVFLRLLGRERPAIAHEWDLYAYRKGSFGEFQPGPEVPPSIELRGIQVGAGSVGGGFDYALASLPVRGELAIVDPQPILEENFGPHPLVGDTTTGTKVALAAAILLAGRGDALHVRPYAEPFRYFTPRLGGEVPSPEVVISALDKVRPRHQVQRLWAPLYIDAATGQLQCQVIVRMNPGSGRCLIEAFDPGAESEEEDVWSQMTGLLPERLSDPMAPITQDDVASAPPQFRQALTDAQAAGRRVCNVVIAAELGTPPEAGNFAAATPFNALLVGALAAGELIKSTTVSRDGIFVQFDFRNQRFFTETTRSEPRCECQYRDSPPA